MAFTSNHSDLKQINRLAVVNIVKKQPGLSRADIAKFTGLNKSTIGKIVQDLIDEFWLKEEAAPTQLEGAGRRPVGLMLNGDVLTLLGADFGVDYLAVVACSITGEVRFQSIVPFTHSDEQESLNRLADVLSHTWQLMHSLNHQILGLGVAVPGLVNVKDEQITDLPNLAWQNLDLITMLQNRFEQKNMPAMPITIINDANAGALCEFVFGMSQFEQNPLVYLTLNAGVGAGIVNEHGLFEGYNGWAGEIGHSILQSENGRLCACGQFGCVETLISQRALHRELMGEAKPMLSIEEMLALLAQGDVRVREGLVKIGNYLGIVLRNVANVFNPKTIIIGGAMARFGDALYVPTMASFISNSNHTTYAPSVLMCPFGQSAAAMGAAAAVLTKHIEPEKMPLHVRQRGLLRK